MRIGDLCSFLQYFEQIIMFKEPIVIFLKSVLLYPSRNSMFIQNPSKVVENAVKGMLPKSRLGNAIFKNLYVYNGSEHKHEAQQPKELKLNSIK